MKERIKAARTELGYTQGELALHCNTTKANIRRWESGERPSLSSVVKLSIALGKSLEWLVKGVIV